MTVEELANQLLKMPPNAKVVRIGAYSEVGDAASTEPDKGSVYVDVECAVCNNFDEVEIA